MSGMPSVVVKKAGFLSAVATGFFGLLTVTVLCGSGLGFYGLHILDRKAGTLLGYGEKVIERLPEWQKALPPMLADALRDRRDPNYREQVEVTCRVEPHRTSASRALVVIEAKNKGRETVSLMAARVVVEDRGGVPSDEFRTYIATPVTLDEDDWRGPLLPGATRRFVRRIDGTAAEIQASVEVTEIRVWDESRSAAEREATARAAAADPA